MGRIKDIAIEIDELQAEAEQMEQEGSLYSRLSQEAFRRFLEEEGFDLSAEADACYRQAAAKRWQASELHRRYH